MILVFDWVSSHGYIGLFSKKKEEIAHRYFYIAGNESSRAGEVYHTFLEENNISLDDITNIVCVVGPGSFTGVRTLTLIVNTLAYTHPHISLTPLSFFDLFTQFPQIKSSSKRDLFVKWEKDDIIRIISNEDFIRENTSNPIYGDVSDTRFDALNIESTVDYAKILQNITLENHKRLSPLYVKKPNIT